MPLQTVQRARTIQVLSNIFFVSFSEIFWIHSSAFFGPRTVIKPRIIPALAQDLTLSLENFPENNLMKSAKRTCPANQSYPLIPAHLPGDATGHSLPAQHTTLANSADSLYRNIFNTDDWRPCLWNCVSLCLYCGVPYTVDLHKSLRQY